MQDKTVIHMVPEPRKSELTKACYTVIGCIFEVYKQLGAGLPEYIYQEALCWGPQRKPKSLTVCGGERKKRDHYICCIAT